MTDVQVPQQKRAPRMAYSIDLQHKIDQLLMNQNKMEVQLAELRTSMMSRNEIDAELDKRVSATSHLADMVSVDKRLSRLEEAPTSNWAKAGIAISSGIGCLGLLISAVSVIVALVATRII